MIFLFFNSLFSILSAIVLNVNFFNQHISKVLFAVLKLLNGLASNVYSIAVVFGKGYLDFKKWEIKIKILFFLVIELTGPSKRILASNFVAYSLVLSNLSLSVLSHYVRNYKILSIVIATIVSIFPCYFWFLDLLNKIKQKLF